MGEISVQIDLSTDSSTGEHKVTVKGEFKFSLHIVSFRLNINVCGFSGRGERPQVGDRVGHVPAVCRGEPDWAAPAGSKTEAGDQGQVEQLVAQVQRDVPFVSQCQKEENEVPPSSISSSNLSTIT